MSFMSRSKQRDNYEISTSFVTYWTGCRGIYLWLTGRNRGLGNVVGIATELRAGRSGNRILVGTRFYAPVQTGPGAHPASCTMGTVSFPGGKERPGRDADPSPPSSAVGHERVELYLYSYMPYGLYRASVPVQGWPLPFLIGRNRREIVESCIMRRFMACVRSPNAIWPAK